jgi:uncharacterized protein (DUF433 family)
MPGLRIIDGWIKPPICEKGRLDRCPSIDMLFFMNFPELERITFDPAQMGGKPCIRGLRVTVGTIIGLIASGADRDEILRLYPYLELDDIVAALAYASWRAEERELPLAASV